MAYTEVTKTQKDLDVINWLDSHLIILVTPLIYDIVSEELLAPVSPTSPTGQITEDYLVITNPFNGMSQKFDHKLVVAYPDEALLEISNYLHVAIKRFERYTPPSHLPPPTIIDGHDVSLKPFNPIPDSYGLLGNANDVYPVNYVWRDENGSYQKKEVGGWAFVPYYRWVKLPSAQLTMDMHRELNSPATVETDQELEAKIQHLNAILDGTTT